MLKNIHIWFPEYIKQAISRKLKPIAAKSPLHIMFCFVDHFEPEWKKADQELQGLRVSEWVEKYPLLARKHKDADGYYPKHTFFYPVEVYCEAHVSRLADLCLQGFGEVEIHLHHDGDTAAGLRKKIEEGKAKLAGHGLLGKDPDNEISFGFIHGNWALNNSRPDRRWCGVNNEGVVLKGSGCYADFTMPSAPSPTQTEKINSIYYETGDPLQPKAHNKGNDVAVKHVKQKEDGKWKKDDRSMKAGDTSLHDAEEGWNKADEVLGGENRLMLIQGPLTLNWKQRKWGIFPKIENGDIAGYNLPSSQRVDLWVQQHIHVKGKPDWIFIKVHTHGAQDENMRILLGGSLDRMLTHLEEKYNDGQHYVLHYVSAREMYNIIKAAEAGLSGNPGEYREYLIRKNIKVHSSP